MARMVDNGSAWRVFGPGGSGSVPPDDRGLAYGDSLFETMRAHRGEVPWWDAHWARLRHGSGRLGIALPPESEVHGQARALLDGADAVLRLQLTRGSGGRDQSQQEEQAKTALAATTHGISDAIDANAGWARARSRCHPSTSGWSGQRRAPSRATGRIPRTALVRTTASAVSTSAGASPRCSIG